LLRAALGALAETYKLGGVCFLGEVFDVCGSPVDTRIPHPPNPSTTSPQSHPKRPPNKQTPPQPAARGGRVLRRVAQALRGAAHAAGAGVRAARAVGPGAGGAGGPQRSCGRGRGAGGGGAFGFALFSCVCLRVSACVSVVSTGFWLFFLPPLCRLPSQRPNRLTTARSWLPPTKQLPPKAPLQYRPPRAPKPRPSPPSRRAARAPCGLTSGSTPPSSSTSGTRWRSTRWAAGSGFGGSLGFGGWEGAAKAGASGPFLPVPVSLAFRFASFGGRAGGVRGVFGFGEGFGKA
jgi:hypothetical protein